MCSADQRSSPAQQPGEAWRRWLAAARGRAGSLYRWLTGRSPRGETNGLPESLAWETLEALCREYRRAPLVGVSYKHLSGWKTGGAYRIRMTLRGGEPWRLIFKNDDYGEEAIPALVGMPVRPGPPEYLVYSNARGALAAFLPTVYLCQEVVPGRCYQYLLEDLLPAHYVAHSPEDRRTIAGQLLDMQAALESGIPPEEQARLLCYDAGFTQALQGYFVAVMERYVTDGASDTALRVWELWPQIAEVHARPEYQRLQRRAPIHGDLNASNVMLPQDGRGPMKLIDWEWAGMGVLHADLASLLKSREPQVEQQVAEELFSRDRRLSSEEHRQLYLWCQLERAIMDAAYVGAQSLAVTGPTKLNLPAFAEDSLAHVLRRYEQLTGRLPQWGQ